jgi:hypothetical protein
MAGVCILLSVIGLWAFIFWVLLLGTRDDGDC